MQISILLIILVITSCTACSTLLPQRPKNILNQNQFVIAQLYDRQITCLSAKRYSCGLQLTQCSDGLSYECIDNATVFSLEGFKESEKLTEDQ